MNRDNRISRAARRLRQLIAAGRWTHIETIRHDESHRAFLPICQEVKQTILKDISPEARGRCEAAFAQQETCCLLYRTIRETKPKVVIETGTFLGLSALVSAMALRENHRQGGIHGRIYAIGLDTFYRVDHPLERAVCACRELGLTAYVHFLEGSSTALNWMESTDSFVAQRRQEYLRQRLVTENRECLLNRLAAILEKVDVAFLDSLHYEAIQMSEIAALLEHIKEGGCVFIDDALLCTRRDDFRHLAGSLLRLDLQLHRLLDFLRCGFRFYYAPWIVDCFRWSELARVSFFRAPAGFLRIIKLENNPSYHTPYGRLSTWFAGNTLEEFLARYEMKGAEPEK